MSKVDIFDKSKYTLKWSMMVGMVSKLVNDEGQLTPNQVKWMDTNYVGGSSKLVDDVNRGHGRNILDYCNSMYQYTIGDDEVDSYYVEGMTPRETTSEQAGYCLQDIEVVEDLRYKFANSAMSDQEAYDHGFLDELGRTTEYAQFDDDKVELYTSEGLDAEINRLENILEK